MNARRAKRLIAGFLLLLLVLAFLGLRYLPARGVQKQLGAIRAAGLPASSSELDAWYKGVPSGANQALLIAEAAKVRVEPGKNPDPTADLELAHVISTQQEAAMKAFLASNAPALALLREAAGKTESRYPIDLSQGPSTLLPHLAHVKGLTILLRVEATEQAHLGNVPAAVEAVQTSFAVARSLVPEPLLISDLVRIACVSITLNPLERIVSEHALTSEQLRKLSQDVAEAESTGPRALFRALVGERAGGLSVFKLSFAEMERLSSGNPPGANPLRGLGYQLYRATGMLQRDQGIYLDMMGGFVDSTRLEFPELIQQSQRVETNMSERFAHGLGRLAIFSRMLLPALSKAAQKEAILSARLRCAEIALAIERFRGDHGDKLPDTLDQLSPTYLHKIPRDPLDGGALVYERGSDKGYRIISQGATRARGQIKGGEPVQFSVLR